MKTEIIIKNLSKDFNGHYALKNVSLRIGEGMFGLIGKNGAGKTTLMRILATLLNKSDGNVSVCGLSTDKPKEIRKLIGYLPQEFSIYPNMRVDEAMDYLGVLSGLPKNERKERTATLLNEVNLYESRRFKVKALSGGMKRRLGIAQALLHDPKVLIVDEPTAGLDPEERIRFRNLLCGIADDKIVLLSTHIVEDIERTCKTIGVLSRGELIYNGSLKEFIGNEQNLEDAFMNKMGGLE